MWTSLDISAEPLSIDCGGDCWGCVGEFKADMGCPESLAQVRKEAEAGLRHEWIDPANLDVVAVSTAAAGGSYLWCRSVNFPVRDPAMLARTNEFGDVDEVDAASRDEGQEMLDLSSPRWGDLSDAYGSAGKIPELLRHLSALPSDHGSSEPWFSLWSALAHQGDVYSTSFAAVPHVVAAIASSPERVPDVYFHFPAWIEIADPRMASIADELAIDYFDSLSRIPALVAGAEEKQWNAAFTACALSATAAAKGQHELAEALPEADLIGHR